MRTTTYTQEFVWEDVYKGREEDIITLLDIVDKGTQSTRRRRKTADPVSETAYLVPTQGEGDDDENNVNSSKSPATPRKKQKLSRVTTPSQRKYGHPLPAFQNASTHVYTFSV